MSQLLVSIIIPTYNRASLLEKSLQSVLSQSYKHIEVIVVDDHSHDNTVKVVELLMERNGRIKLVLNRVHYGLPQSRNIGLAYARGDLIFFSEDDMILSTNTIEELVNTYLSLSSKLKIGAIAPRVILKSKKTSYVDCYMCRCIVGLLNTLTGEPCFSYDIKSDSILLAHHPPATSMIPKHIFNKVGVYFTGYKFNYRREESDLFLRILREGYVFIYQPKAIVYHISGLRGGCTVKNVFKNNIADIHNHLIYLIRGYGIKASYMFATYILKRLLKLKHIKNDKAHTTLTKVEKIGFIRALNNMLVSKKIKNNSKIYIFYLQVIK